MCCHHAALLLVLLLGRLEVGLLGLLDVALRVLLVLFELAGTLGSTCSNEYPTLLRIPFGEYNLCNQLGLPHARDVF